MTPTVINLFSTAFTIGADLILVRYLAVAGVSIGRSIGFTFSALVLFYILRRRIGPLGIRKIVSSLSKFILASAFMGLVAYFSLNYLLLLFPPISLRF
jgi:putative peptidoglycan lipid II flippase